MNGRLTILVVAKNAGATIARAVASACADPCPLVLVDDGSDDDTVRLAQEAAGPRLEVVRAAGPGGLARARQIALDATATPYAAFLDADDEWIAGRAARLCTRLDAGADVVTDDIELVDGTTGLPLRRLTVPTFVRRPGGIVRLFERNVLPGDTQVGLRADCARAAGGYDAAVTGPESFDLLLRVIRSGGVFAHLDDLGYRMHAYPGSVSRHRARQQAALALVLRKHRYADVRELYSRRGFTKRVAAWALVMMATQRHEPQAGLAFLDDACPGDGSDEVLEPDGPWPFSEAWRRAFHGGTLALLMGESEVAASRLAAAEALRPTPEGLNNLGVAWARLGLRVEAAQAFGTALSRRPGYADAAHNAVHPTAEAITLLPLRHLPSRSEYANAP